MTALKLANNSRKATLKDFKVVNDMVKRIKMKKNEVSFSKIGDKDDMMVAGIGDASYKVDEKAIGGNIVLMKNKKNEKVLPLFWKSKSIQQVCHSAKDVETKNMIKLMDESLFQASLIKQMLFGDRTEVVVEIYTDSKPLLDSVASSKQVECKMMRPVIADMKEKLVDGSIKAFKWLETREMVADILTNEKVDGQIMDAILEENRCDAVLLEKNKVVSIGSEVRMLN